MKKSILLLLMGCLLFTGCKADKLEVVILPNEPPTAHIDSISSTEVYLEDAVTLVGHGTDPDGMIIAFNWRSNLDGQLSKEASFDISSLSAGEHIIYFEVKDNDGTWSDEVRGGNILVIDKSTIAPPVIEYFRTDPTRIGLGDSSVLSRYVTEATTVYIDKGIGNVAFTGNIEVSPALSTLYTLTGNQ